MSSMLTQISELRTLSPEELRQRWAALHGAATLNHNRRAMEDRLAYRIQELSLGGLKPSTIKRLEALGETLDGGSKKVRRKRADSLPAPGTRLIREWKGVEHTVTVLTDGFDYMGQQYASLSPIAKRVTGTSWNGLVFFGLKKQSASR
jgi:hypothetical protein